MKPSRNSPVALVTGAARRIGAAIVRHLHENGYRVIVHYRSSAAAADALVDELEAIRAGSASAIGGDLKDAGACNDIAQRACAQWSRLDLLVNNASSFYPTAVGETSESQWNDLLGSNLKAPYFLAQACLPWLREQQGSIVNLVDIHGMRPLGGHAVYSVAKAGLDMLTRALAKELAPEVRVNGIAPGAILWPENGMSDADRQYIVQQTPLQRAGSPEDIARAVRFLAENGFVTGQVVAVDGGRGI